MIDSARLNDLMQEAIVYKKAYLALRDAICAKQTAVDLSKRKINLLVQLLELEGVRQVEETFGTEGNLGAKPDYGDI